MRGLKVSKSRFAWLELAAIVSRDINRCAALLKICSLEKVHDQRAVAHRLPAPFVPWCKTMAA